MNARRCMTVAAALFFLCPHPHYGVTSICEAQEEKTFRLKNGATMTASEIVKHNKTVDARMRQAAKGLAGFDAARLQNAQNNVSLIVKYVQNGDREKLRGMMRQSTKLNKYARGDIDFYLQRTPAGSYMVACEDGEAMTWMDAYSVGLGALIESEMAMPGR